MRRTLLTAIFAGCLCAAAAARADLAPVALPSFDRFNMTLRVSGREYPVVLHQGTVIQPRGTTLAPSMVVNVQGYWQAGAFYANRIVVVRY
jgi:hypothetical protein